MYGMQHNFDVEIACKYGILEAVILNNLAFWIEHNKANNTNFHDGYYWTYNSTKAFSELMPYASPRQIQRAINHLKDENIIQTGNYNKSAYDRTLWYAFTEKGKSILPFGEMEEPKKGNGNNETVQPIPDINTSKNSTDIKTDKKTKTGARYFPNDEKLESAFKDFLDMRKKLKKPMTDRAITLSIKELEKLSADTFGAMDNDKAIEIINQSIVKGWLTFYPLKEQTAKQSGGGIDWSKV